ncbi:MAG: lipopolysaccharide biosynthesis protein [Phycisphaerae bacterium]|nr:lipopolysaccharide biosynthesis protein [Phycisphaerae bacterium]
MSVDQHVEATAPSDTPPPTPPQPSLRNRAVRSGAYTLVSQWSRFVLRFVGLVVLSRLLVREDFGLAAMVTAFSGFAALFADAGLTQAATRSRDLTREQASTLFWINLGVATMVAIALASCSPLIAKFYDGEERLIPITLVASGGIILGALTAQHIALLQRELKFGWLAVAEVSSQTTGTIVAIAIAWTWRTYWALVVQPIATQLVYGAICWSATGWRPGRPRIAPGTRALLTTGSHLSGTEVLNYAQVNADVVILGRWTGPGPVGEYSRALGLLMLPLSQVLGPFTRVAVPLLSRLQDQPERFARAYYRMVALVAILTTPIIAILMLGARDIIAIVLGPNFAEAGSLFQILAIAAWGMPIAATATWVAIASGHTKRLLARNAIKTALYIVGFLIAVHWGAVGIAWAYVIATHALRYPVLFHALHNTPVSVKGMAKAAWPGTFVGIVGAIAMAFPMYVLDLPQPIVSLAVTVSIGVAVMGLMVFLWPRARREAKEALDMLRSLRGRKAAAPA